MPPKRMFPWSEPEAVRKGSNDPRIPLTKVIQPDAIREGLDESLVLELVDNVGVLGSRILLDDGFPLGITNSHYALYGSPRATSGCKSHGQRLDGCISNIHSVGDIVSQDLVSADVADIKSIRDEIFERA